MASADDTSRQTLYDHAPRRRARGYLIDPRFQLKYTGLLVGVVVALMAALGVVIWRTADAAASHAALAVGEAARATQESQTSSRLMRMNSMVESTANPEMVRTLEAELVAIDRQAARDVTRVGHQREQIERQRARMRYLLVGAGVALVLLLAAMGIVITQKIVGPVFKLKRLLRRVGTGRLVVRERLRRGDELNDLFDTFVQTVWSLKAQQTGRLATVDAMLRRAEETAVPPDFVRGLRALRTQMRLGLGEDVADGRSAPMAAGAGAAPHPILQKSIDALCARFAKAGFSPTPIIDLGALVANADGTVDEEEFAVLRQILPPLLGAQFDVETVEYLVGASLKVVEAAGVEARARLIAEVLLDCDAVEDGLVVALAIGCTSGGLSDAERKVVASIARAAGFAPARLDALSARVRGALEPAATA